jgi:hypothetical protein
VSEEHKDESSDMFGHGGQAGGDMPTLDLGSVKTGFDPLPISAYVCVVESCVHKIAASSGEPTLAWRFKIIEGEESIVGRLLFVNTSLQPQALWKLKETLAAIGEDVESDNYTINPSSYLGRKAVVVVEGHQEYEGTMRDRVGKIKPYEPEPQL